METDASYPVRPDLRTFTHAGATVTLVDAERILVLDDGQRVELLGGVAFPPPVRAVSVTVTRDELDAYLDASIRTGTEPSDRAGLTVLGNDPIGVFLSKRVESGDPWATRIVDGVGGFLANVSRRLEPERPAPGAEPADVTIIDVESEVRDSSSGLVATAKTTERTIALRSTVPAAELSVEHLEGFCRLVLDAVAEATSPDALTGQVVTVSATSGSPERVTLDQVGGLDDIVQELREIAASFRHPQALARWGAKRPQGALFYGPPGTGKTMLARALANEIGARFREIRTTEILDKWLGASERNIKQIFRDARRYTEPTVMLFDEFDTIIGYASEGGDAASQAINSVAGIFKQEMNTLIDANPNVFVVATTNFPERIDPSLVRSGRFDIKLAVPAPDPAGRAQILAKMIRQQIVEHEVPGFRMFADDVDIVACATLSQGLTGADLKEVLRRAQLSKAMREARTGTPATAISQDDLRRQIEAVRAAATPARPAPNFPALGRLFPAPRPAPPAPDSTPPRPGSTPPAPEPTPPGPGSAPAGESPVAPTPGADRADPGPGAGAS
ncbi:ATP-binding protein [Cryptosporangium arvum]|uniref:ATP-binding protein n=1 Tax=Cryptosporangium arvum TaxID=80871 RepID=UPI0007C445E0|nr:ATP-binding protein [Cryptosporangium arvum]